MIVRTPTEFSWVQPDYDQVDTFDVITRVAATNEQVNGSRIGKPSLGENGRVAISPGVHGLTAPIGQQVYFEVRAVKDDRGSAWVRSPEFVFQEFYVPENPQDPQAR